jgi:hypothetical protein
MKKSYAALAVLALALPLAVPARAQTQSLDGTKWTMKSKSILKKAIFWHKRTISFDAGQISTAKKAGKHAFAPAAYTLGQENGKMTWSAVQTNDKGEKKEWKGTVDGDNMTGTVTWTDAKGKTKTHQFSARKCKPKTAAPAKKP